MIVPLKQRVLFSVKILVLPDLLLMKIRRADCPDKLANDCLMVEVKFWYLNIACFNGYSIRPLPNSSIAIFTEAIDVAFGGFFPIFFQC